MQRPPQRAAFSVRCAYIGFAPRRIRRGACPSTVVVAGEAAAVSAVKTAPDSRGGRWRRCPEARSPRSATTRPSAAPAARNRQRPAAISISGAGRGRAGSAGSGQFRPQRGKGWPQARAGCWRQDVAARRQTGRRRAGQAGRLQAPEFGQRRRGSCQILRRGAGRRQATQPGRIVGKVQDQHPFPGRGVPAASQPTTVTPARRALRPEPAHDQRGVGLHPHLRDADAPRLARAWIGGQRRDRKLRRGAARGLPP